MTQEPVTWLADALRNTSLTVVEHDGWKTRGRPPSTGGFTPRAVIWHHDASALGPSPTGPQIILQGRPPTDPGPLAHAWVAVDGTWHVLAAGRCNHAGLGDGWGVIPKNDGNTYAIGVETDHTVGEKWPEPLLDALRRGTAAVLRRLNANPSRALCGHKEYAPGRKVDPAGLTMSSQRSLVAALMNGDDDMPLTDADVEKIMRWRLDLGGGKSIAVATALKRAAAGANEQAIAAAVTAQITTGGAADQATVEAALRNVLGSLDD